MQTTAAPGTQVPPEQVSPVVQAFPSLQEAVLLVKTQPVAGSHVSVVQTLLSLQMTAVPGTQVPPEQVSPAVQAFPSLHAAALFVKTQPAAESHVSVVQTLLSLQTTGVPEWQVPPEQVSPAVQAFPSLHAAALLVKTHPVPVLHESVVQTLLSLQTTAAPGTQVPPEQVSPAVQAFPSLHAPESVTVVDPDAELFAGTGSLLALDTVAVLLTEPLPMQ